jgi:hypothetical protein
MVIQRAKPWMSANDIEKGSRGLNEVSKALEGIRVGIVCLTPENLKGRWLLFEAGALSKGIDDKTRLCTYLIGDLKPEEIEPPLGMFQATRSEKEDTRKLVHAINNALSDDPINHDILNRSFDLMWPELEKVLRELPVPEISERPPKRDMADMVAELLERSRADANRKKQSAHLDEFLPIFEELLPYIPEIREAIRQATKNHQVNSNYIGFSGRSAAPTGESSTSNSGMKDT